MRVRKLRHLLLLGCILIATKVCHAQDDSLQSRIVLIGDGGELTKGHHPVVDAVRNNIKFDKKTTIIFLGDNLYKYGLPDDATPNYMVTKAALDSQLVIAKGTDAKVYFIPGNHDWQDGSPGGWDAIVREQNYIDDYGDKNIEYFPKGGCPGPVEVAITPDVELVIIDTQWWLHEYEKPGIESDCPFKTKADVMTALDDILSRNFKKLVIIAFHHTLKSVGIHGGYFKLKQHIFPFTDVIKNLYLPLPIIGSIYPLTRGVFGTSEDLSHPLYQGMIHDFSEAVKGHKNVIFASGHEHSLQLIQDSGYTYIVSGSGSKATRVYKNKRSLFASDKNGFVTLEISKAKTVNATYYTVTDDKLTKAFEKNIIDFSKVPIPKEDSARANVDVAYKDSVSVPASIKYKDASRIKRLVLGNNYREEWSTPVKLKVFNIRKEHGGFTIKELGGGKKIKELRLTDKEGKQWVLRPAEKDPEKILPENLRGALPENIVQQLVSASHPYAPLIIPPLANAVGVVAANPEFFFVPDDYRFGSYRLLFANTVCLLERSEPEVEDKETKTTAKIIEKLIIDQDNHVDQKAVLKARLLDIVIGDWDRHFDQWKWGRKDTGKGKLYYPIPRNRDQALFFSDGLLLKYASRSQLQYLQGFKRNIPNISQFNYEARDFDRLFMNELDEKDWKDVIGEFQQELTDSVIDEGVRRLPKEIYAIDGKTISSKLKSRRDELMKQGIKYYRFISKIVTIAGSNDKEYFRVSHGDNRGLNVDVYKRKKYNDTLNILYHRAFEKGITKEIRMYGLPKDDKFEVGDNATSPIRLRMIGGRGNDTFNIKGRVRNSLYDVVGENNAVLHSSRTKVNFSSNPQVNDYRPTGYNASTFSFPQLNIAYNNEDGIFAGIGFSKKAYGFRKEPFSSYQKLSTLYAFSNSAYQLKYQGVFTSAFLKKDVIVNAQLVSPTLNNFFGLGNNTVKDPNVPLEFNRVRYNYLQTDLLLRKRVASALQFSIGPSYYHYWNNTKDNANKILSMPSLAGLDSTSIYSHKDYAGGKARMDIYYVNSDFFPTRGIVWNTEFSSLYGLNSNSKNISKIVSDMTVYGSLSEERKLMGVLRVGGGHIFSKDYEYFQALTLGANNFLRGFRKDRFAGSSDFYSSLEMRVKLVSSTWYLLPGDIGLIGFYDIGRVWVDHEVSNKWHQSYGPGIYYSPFNLLLLSATMGFSNEDQLFNFSLGTKFNITF